MSKRDGAQSVSEYIEEGYLPEALQSFLASLGWNDGTTQEVYTPEELVQKFSLDRIQKSPAKFDKERLIWVNGYMIRQLTIDGLLKRCKPFWPQGADDAPEAYLKAVLGLVQERLKFLSELPELTDFFFVAPPFDVSLVKGSTSEECAVHLKQLYEQLESIDWAEAQIEATMRGYVEKEGLKVGQLFGLVRVALTGRTAAPGLFETMLVLGQTATLSRLEAAAASASNR